MILPVDIVHDVMTLLGVILCLRHSVPHLASSSNRDQGLKDSFGFREFETEQSVGEEQIVKVGMGDSCFECNYCLFINGLGKDWEFVIRE